MLSNNNIDEALYLAIKEKQLDRAKRASQLDANPDSYRDNKTHNFALHWAAMDENVEYFDLLVKLGADVNIQNKNGETPFELALKVKNNRVIQYMLDLELKQKRQDIHNIFLLSLAYAANNTILSVLPIDIFEVIIRYAFVDADNYDYQQNCNKILLRTATSFVKANQSAPISTMAKLKRFFYPQEAELANKVDQIMHREHHDEIKIIKICNAISDASSKSNLNYGNAKILIKRFSLMPAREAEDKQMNHKRKPESQQHEDKRARLA